MTIKFITKHVNSASNIRRTNVNYFGLWTLSYIFPIIMNPIPLHKFIANVSGESGNSF